MKSLSSIFTFAFLATFLSFSSTAYSASSDVLKNKSSKTATEKVIKKAAIAQSVNVNKANAEEISVALKGVGLKKAEAIVKWRKANGKFTNVSQLLEVKGIGEKTLAANKTKIKL